MSDEEIVDPLVTARAKCVEKPECLKLQQRLDRCTRRVTKNAGKTEENCFEEVIDFIQCVDHCAMHGLFKKLV